MANTLFLKEMGMYDNNLRGDVKNHRVRVLENIDVIVKGEKYSMFFEFGSWDKHRVRTTNKRTGEPLKHPVTESVNPNSFHVDTQYDNENGSFRNSVLEREIHSHDYDYTRENILKAVNAYAIKKYDKVVLVREAVTAIVEKLGGYREKAILENDSVISVKQWDDNYKVVTVYERVNNKLGNSFDVELITGRIAG